VLPESSCFPDRWLTFSGPGSAQFSTAGKLISSRINNGLKFFSKKEVIGMRNQGWTATLLIMASVLFACTSFEGRAAEPQKTSLAYNPPAPESAPAEIKDAVMLGYHILKETPKYAGAYVGNALACTNCHFNGGLTKGGKNGGLSLVGVGATYPAYKKREHYAVDLITRTNDCFERSMNGKPLPASSREMTAIVTYYQWISKGLPIYAEIPWLGLPLLKSSHRPNPGAGEKIMAHTCSMCHGSKGEGTPAGPALWGPNSFNNGAGMARLQDFAAFVHLNMPKGNPVLTEGQALDVAAYVTAQPRPHFQEKPAAMARVSPKPPAPAGKPVFQPLPRKPPIPKDNPMTRAKVALGKQLYFDERLSINGTVSCQSCHDAMGSGTSPLPVPFGVYGRLDGHRNDPTVWNAAFKTAQFWDGRAPSLEEQAKGPLFTKEEMGTNPETLVTRVKQIPGYAKALKKVFGGQDPVTVDNIVKAIATYERTLITPDGPFDRYLRGNKRAISSRAKQGAKLVHESGCMSCHFGPNFSGPISPMGQGFFQKFPIFTDNEYVTKYKLLEDLGRYKATHEESDKHMFVVQTLRNIAITAPYFNNGSVGDLGTAVLVMAKTELNKDLTKEQVDDILAFFQTLTGKFPKQVMPRVPETPNTTLFMEFK
jgi:cytochrome c peroxidase